MKLSSRSGVTACFSGLPVGDENLVGVLGLLGSGAFLVAPLLVVVGGAGLTVVAALRRGAGGELELAPLVGDQGRPGEGVVLVLGG